MKLLALYDGSGRILAAVDLVDGYAGPVPVASAADHRTDTFDVPDEHRSKNLAEICTTLRVADGPDKRLVAR